MNYWLMKNEPDDYSIDDLKRDKIEPWDGIRNYQVRNMIRDEMKKGDQAFFYHSNCDVPGIYGLMVINSQHMQIIPHLIKKQNTMIQRVKERAQLG